MTVRSVLLITSLVWSCLAYTPPACSAATQPGAGDIDLSDEVLRVAPTTLLSIADVVHAVPTDNVAPCSPDDEGGVSSFLIPKPTKEQVGLPPPIPRQGINAASDHRPEEALKVSTSLVCEPNSAPGLHLAASGPTGAYHLSFDTDVLMSGSSMQVDTLRLNLASSQTQIEFGDVKSEIYGDTVGVKSSFRPSEAFTYALALYSSGSDSLSLTPALGFEYRWSQKADFRGELASNGAYALRYCLAGAGPSFSAFLKGRLYSSSPDSTGYGVALSYPLLSQGSFYYNFQQLEEGSADPKQSQFARLSFPIYRSAWGAIETVTRKGNGLSTNFKALTISWPLGRVNTLLRLSTEETECASTYRRRTSDSLYATVGLPLSPKAFLRYALDSEKHSTFSGGCLDGTDYTETHRLTGTTKLSDRLELRVSLSLPRHSGQLASHLGVKWSPNPGTSVVLRYECEKNHALGFSITKTFSLVLPGFLGKIEGYVRDTNGKPIGQVSVRAGPATAVTGADGYYVFNGLAPGVYEAYLEPNSIPAQYSLPQGKPGVQVRRGSKVRVDFTLARLASISGVVFMDLDGNGSYDEGEGLKGIPVALDSFVVNTDEHGRFAFFDVNPGKHEVRLVAECLPRNLEPVSPSRWEINLSPDPGRSCSHDLFFTLQRKTQEIEVENLD